MKNPVKYTLAELLQEILKRNNMNSYVAQGSGRLKWMWMGGESNSMVLKGECPIRNLFTLRVPFRQIRSATISSYPPPKELTVEILNKLLKHLSQRTKYHESAYQGYPVRPGRIVFQTSTSVRSQGAIP